MREWLERPLGLVEKFKKSHEPIHSLLFKPVIIILLDVNANVVAPVSLTIALGN